MNNAALLYDKFGHSSLYEEYCLRVAETTIDNKTLLSTDYFNSFNEVVMLLNIAGDMPEVLEEIRIWKFRTYEQHFLESGLPFGALAIEAYAHCPLRVREQFENIISELRGLIEKVRLDLRLPPNDNDRESFKCIVMDYSRQLQSLIEMGSGIVHGGSAKIDQADIDKLF